MYIFSDSMLLIKSMTEWIDNWKKKDWIKSDGEKVKNVDILELLIKEKGNRKIIWEHVKAHTNKTDWKSVWNDKADKLAQLAASNKK